MQEKNSVPEEAQGAEPAPSDDEIRVTDSRRFNADGESRDEAANESASSESAESEAATGKPAYVEQLEARFEQLRARLQRETDETRARLNRAADERTRREKAEFVSALLPVGDNLQRAIEAAEQGGGLDSLLDGVRGTASNFESALVAMGVEPIAAVGAQFDPEIHEAVDTIPVEPEREGMVTAEYSRGYKMNDRLLRPARVQVGRAEAEAKSATE